MFDWLHRCATTGRLSSQKWKHISEASMKTQKTCSVPSVSKLFDPVIHTCNTTWNIRCDANFKHRCKVIQTSGRDSHRDLFLQRVSCSTNQAFRRLWVCILCNLVSLSAKNINKSRVSCRKAERLQSKKNSCFSTQEYRYVMGTNFNDGPKV